MLSRGRDVGGGSQTLIRLTPQKPEQSAGLTSHVFSFFQSDDILLSFTCVPKGLGWAGSQ